MEDTFTMGGLGGGLWHYVRPDESEPEPEPKPKGPEPKRYRLKKLIPGAIYLLSLFEEVESKGMFVEKVSASPSIVKELRLCKGFEHGCHSQYERGIVGFYFSVPIYVDSKLQKNFTEVNGREIV